MPTDTVDRRRFERTIVALSGAIRGPNDESPCQVSNLSQSGAAVSAPGFAALGHQVRLRIDGVGLFVGDVVWRDQDRMGMNFTFPPTRSQPEVPGVSGLDPFLAD